MSENKDIIIAFFEEVYNKRNFDFIMKYFSDEYYENRNDGARTNKDALDITKSACEIFPDLKVKIEDIVEEDLIAVRLKFSGTHTGTYIDAKPTGKFIQWEAMEFFKVKNGQIVESWGSWPNFDILSALK